ncbi:MAG: hypothetical protein CMC97_06380 [Flavobacteriales bacterium]|nr:hypothetical protein [Flavobacteriales bacterium]
MHAKNAAAPGGGGGVRPSLPKPDVTTISQEEASAFIAPTARLYKAVESNRWKVWYPGRKGISRSWLLYGEILALGKCTAWTWHCHEEATGEECPHEWIKKIDWRVGF